MAYWAIFWQPNPGVDVWARSQRGERLGEALFKTLRTKAATPQLTTIPTSTLLAELKEAFPALTGSVEGFDWAGGPQGAFTVTWSTQHIAFCCFDLDDDVLERIAAMMELHGLTLFDR
jgi:hypothetical protein